jgi:NAD(P)-dependent dehydrogenase (short-subunit alcohol dehydrogenase family)
MAQAAKNTTIAAHNSRLRLRTKQKNAHNKKRNQPCPPHNTSKKCSAWTAKRPSSSAGPAPWAALSAADCPRPGVDVTSRQSLAALLEEATKPTGRCDILVNCAGVNNGTDFLDHTEEWWDRVMDINLKGTFLACQVFGRHMVDNGSGSIVNIGSVTSHLPLSRVFGYSVSKAGVLNLTRNIAQDFGTKGVRVNAICPGFFPAGQNRKLLDKDRVDSIMRGTPMQRFGEPDELVGALLLLVSPKAGQFITGSHVSVDGGFTAAWF